MHDKEPSATFAVCLFPTAGGAERALTVLEGMQDRGALVLDDLAVTTWPDAATRSACWQELPLGGRHAFPLAVWDGLFGALPLSGTDVGQPASEGLPDEVRHLLAGRVVPGTSALCFVTRAPIPTRLCAALRRRGAIVSTAFLDAQMIVRLRCGDDRPAEGEPG